MWSVRPADVSDLPVIYELQNSTFRSQVFDSELPSQEQFIEEKQAALAAGDEKLYVLQKDWNTVGFISFGKESNFWNVTIWGTWLKTLVYAAGMCVFRHLNSPRLIFCIRDTNKRMIKLCNEYEFRLIGHDSRFVTFPDPPYVGIAQFSYFDITAEEFDQRVQKMRERSLPLQFQW